MNRSPDLRPPLTLLNYAGGHHGFEAEEDNDVTRQVIVDTLDFVDLGELSVFASCVPGGGDRGRLRAKGDVP